ncbi:MAG: hypothetical protein HC763_28755 [Hydrococcus sp. CRU_1_1]|nr:hypothetical protein [Hydrococcus sp. CRU_1_1]
MKTKQIQWKTLLLRTTFWLITEVVLNAVGLDNLADYSEFVFERNTIAQGQRRSRTSKARATRTHFSLNQNLENIIRPAQNDCET